MDRSIKKEDVYTVKIYFIKPIDLISVVVNTLIEMEYETYTVSEFDAEKLPRILPEDRRNVLFICVTSRQEAQRWLEYAQTLRDEPLSQIQIGVFAFSNIDSALKEEFLMNQISVTPFDQLRQNTLGVLRTILQIFECRGQRQYIRVKAQGHSEALISVSGRDQPIKGSIVDLSTSAFVCDVPEIYHHYFGAGQYIREILLVLRGVRIRTAAKFLGYSQENKNHFIMKFCTLSMKDGRFDYEEQISRGPKQKLCNYIRTCLKDSLMERLSALAAK
jgi:hypothetical protein